MSVCLFVCCLLTVCASIDYGQPTTYPNSSNLLSKWEAHADFEGREVLEEVFSFFDNGEWYLYNHHNLKNDVAETGTWTGSLEPGGVVELTVDWYRGKTSSQEGGFYGGIGYRKDPPPIIYTAEISMDGKTLTAERWDYAIKNEREMEHSGATHKDYARQELPQEQQELEEEN